ncbi:MAG: hypothetical protein HOH74_32470, partial [Gemmatimonadetes bacterium]|nr:hypothetical protein [Gemmatimonadota bacterium]
QDVVVLSAAGSAVMVTLWAPLRRRIVEPRAGYVEFSQARQIHTRTGLRATFLLCVCTLLLGVGAFFYLRETGNTEPLGGFGHVLAGIPAVLLAVGAVVTARITAARRFAAYAMVLLLAGVVTAVMHWRPEVPMLVSGTGVSLSGLVLVVRFLRASADFASDLDE